MKTERGFRCGPERHLWASGLQLAIYEKMAGVTWVKARQTYGVYHSSIQNLADYFGVFRQSAQRAIASLVECGWLAQVEPKYMGNVSVRRLRADANGHKDYRVVSHEEWLEGHPNAKCCFVPDSMPWDSEKKDSLALALHRESKGHVRWYPNLLKALRKTGETDATIETAYHENVATMENEPRTSRGWQSNAFKFVADYAKAHSSS